MLSVAISMLCKEQGITITGICAVYEIFVAQKLQASDIKHFFRSLVKGKALMSTINWWPHEATCRLITLCTTTVGLLLFRLYIMGSQLPVFTRFDNPASVADSPARQLTYNYLISINLWLLLFPCELCCDWTMGTVAIVESIYDYRNLFTLLTFVGVGGLLWIAVRAECKQMTSVVIMVSIEAIFLYQDSKNSNFLYQDSENPNLLG
jgi:hypothetical protein